MNTSLGSGLLMQNNWKVYDLHSCSMSIQNPSIRLFLLSLHPRAIEFLHKNVPLLPELLVLVLWRLPYEHSKSFNKFFVVFVSLSCQTFCTKICLYRVSSQRNVCLNVWLSSLMLQIFFHAWIFAKTTHRRSVKSWSFK